MNFSLIDVGRLGSLGAKGLLSASILLTVTPPSALAQTPGEWQYTITTDLRPIPVDMRVNFPTVSFKACRTASDFETGRAFALQTLASSEARCASANFERSRTRAADGKVPARFEFSCDGGRTLSGTASGSVAATRFEFTMTTRYPEPVSGVSGLQQTMRARYAGPCKSAGDQDEVKVP